MAETKDQEYLDKIYGALENAYKESGAFTLSKEAFVSKISSDSAYADKIHSALDNAYGANGSVATGAFSLDKKSFMSKVMATPRASAASKVLPSYLSKKDGPVSPAVPKPKTPPPMAEMPTLNDRRSRSAQVGTELAAKEKIQKETTRAFNSTVVGNYDVFQKEAKDAMEKNRAIVESNIGNTASVLDKASKYPTSKILQGIQPAGGFDLAAAAQMGETGRASIKADIERNTANAIAIKADVADKRSRAADARRNIDELFMPIIDKAISEGVEKFYKEETFQEGARLADPYKVEAFVNKIIIDSGGTPGNFSREYLTKNMLGKVDAYETIKKQTEIADKEFEKKYGFKPNEVYKVAEQAKLELDKSAASLMTTIEAEREIAVNQVTAPIQKAIKDSEGGLKQYYDQYTSAFQLLQAEVAAGRMPVDQAQAQLDQLNAQRAEREKVYQAEVDQYAQQYEAVQKTINSKFSSRLTRQYAEIEQAAKDKLAKFYKEGEGLDPAILNDYKDMFERAGEATKKLQYIEATAAKSPIVLDVKELGMSLVNGFGNAIRTYAPSIGWEGGKILGEDMARTFAIVSPEIESGWDLLKPGKFASSAGFMIGNMGPQLIAQAALAKLTLGMSVTARLAITGSVGLGLETTQIASAARSEEFARSGDAVKADKAAEIVISDNLKDWYLYTLDGLPFIKNIGFGIKGKGILPTLGRAGTRAGVEVFTESIQEIRQTGAEERARLTVAAPMEKEVRLASFSKIIRNNMYMDSNGKDLKSSQTPYTTFLNVLPSTMLMGGFGEVASYATNKTAYAAGSVAALKNRFSEVSENFHAQYMYDMFLRKGENFTAGYITTLNRQGLINDQQFTNITAQFDKLAEVRDIAARTKMSAGSSKVLFALQNDLDNNKSILDNAQTEVEREMAEVKYNAAKSNLSSFLSGKNPNYVVMQLRSGEQYVATYDEFEQLLNTPSFINDAKSNIRVSVIGSGKTTGGLTLSTELQKKLGIVTPTPEEQAAIQEQGTPLQEILGNTEQPYVNAMVENLDQRMANAEEIPTSDMNTALEGLYAQLDLVYNNHFDEPSGKAAAKIITDKIDQLQNYEFRTDKETQIIAETAAVQTARNAVEQELSTIQVAGRREQPGKPARRATVTLEDGTTANYTIRVEDGNVTLNPVSGAPLTMGDARSVNESMGFVESKMGANGMPTSVTFTMQGTAAERGRKTVTLSTANGYTQEELLDIAINLRAKEIGTVDPTAFDEAFRTVSQQEVEVTTFPNIQQDAIQEQAAGQVPVQPGTRGRQEVAQREPQAGPQEVTPTREGEAVVEGEGEAVVEEGAIAQAPTAGQRLLPVQVQERVDRIAQSIRGLGVEVVVTNTPEEWSATMSRLGQDPNLVQGVFVGTDRKIYLNPDQLVTPDGEIIAFHEGTHPIVNVIRNTNKPLFDRLVNQARAAARANATVGAVLRDAEASISQRNLTPRDLQLASVEARVNDELVTELIARIAGGDININQIPRSLLDTVLEFVNEIAKMLGLPQITNVGSAEARRTMTQISNALRSGADITGIVGEITPSDILFTEQGQARSIKDINVNEIRTKDRPGKKISKGLSVKTVNKVKVIEETEGLSLDYVKENAPKVFIENANLISKYPIVAAVKKFKSIRNINDAQEVYDIFSRQVADNLKFLYDNFRTDLREISTLWYDGANVIAQKMSAQYGVTMEQVAGIIASLSPQKDWYQNVRLGELVLMAFRDNPIMTDQMIARQEKVIADSLVNPNRDLRKAQAAYKKSRSKKNELAVDKIQSSINRKIEKGGKVVEMLREYVGQNLNDVPNHIKPYMVRLHHEINTTKFYDQLTPDGNPAGQALNIDGSPSEYAWGSYIMIGKAVNIYLDGSPENITRTLGEEHKIRNFYNNIIDPMSPDGDVTIDTHAVAAGLLMPLSGNSELVMQNLGSGTSNSGPLGISGIYYAYSDAYQLAARELGLLPRQVQSVTWEAVRGVFKDTFKSDKKNVAAVNEIWSNYESGKIDINEARNQVVEKAGGFKDPTWVGGSIQEGVRGGTEETGVRKGGKGDGRGAVGATGGGLVQTSAMQRGDRIGKYDVLPGAPQTKGNTGPIPDLVDAAESYAKKFGIPYTRQGEYVKVDEVFSKRIADAYEEMKHDPQNPKVKEAYADLIRQTKDQYQALIDAGYEFTFFDSKTDPYNGNPVDAMRDLRNNKRMAVYGTYDGYGTEGITGANIEDNPMLEDTGLKWPDQSGVMRPVTANDLLRAVHDTFGHGLEGAGFRARGEENAWQAHVRLFTGPAVAAITSETRGQNSWMNFGPFGEKNRTAKLEESVFAEQKTGLMPEWTWTENVAPPMAQFSAMRRGDRVSGTYYEPHLTTDENGNYVFFHVSTAPERNILKGIDSRKFTSLRTSREEKGLQYGVASFYTKPDDGERMVGGDKYYVTVAPDKVYPMDADPNGYRTAAEKKIKPGTPFREEKIRKAVAEAAAKDGFQMAVGEWAYDATAMTSREIPAMRGDALTVLKPKVYTGDENFQTGMDRGINTPHPMQAFYEAKIKLEEIAYSIKSELSKKRKYEVEGYTIADNVSNFGGIIENYGEDNEEVRDLTPAEFSILYEDAGKANKDKLDEIRSAYLGMQGQASIGFTRRMATNQRLNAILPGVNLENLRDAIKRSPTSFYTPQKFSEIKDRLTTMTEAELLSEINFTNSSALIKIFTQTEGPVSGLAFLEYINRYTAARDQALLNNDQQLADMYEQNLKFAYETMEAFSTKVAQILRQLGEVKSVLNTENTAETYANMIERMILSKGGIISDEQRKDLVGHIKKVLDTKADYKTLYTSIVNNPNATQDDIDLLNIAQANMIQAELALGLYTGYLVPRTIWQMISGWIKGNLVSLRTVFLGLFSNTVSFGLIRAQNIVSGITNDVLYLMNKAGVNTYGLEKYGLFATSKPVKAAGYALFPATMLYDAIRGLTKASIAIGKVITGKESFSDYMDRSPFAFQTLNVLKYGASAMENSSIIEYDSASHPMWNMQRAIGKGGARMEIRAGNEKIMVQRAFKIVDFNKWLNGNLPPGSDFNSLPADEKKRLRDAFMSDQAAMMPTVTDRFLNGTEAFFSWNAEMNFRLIAMSDVLPKEYARRIEFDRLSGNMGLSDVQRQLFIKDPMTFITNVQTNMTPEMIDWWMDNISEMTATKDTGIGKMSMAMVQAIKTLPSGIANKLSAGKAQDIPLMRTIINAWATGVDTIIPFVRIPMNFTSFALDFVVPYKSLAKAAYFSSLAYKNRGTAMAESYTMSSAKYVSRAVIGYALQNLAIQLLTIPGMVSAGSPKDDDDEEKKFAKKIPRNSINTDALWRYVKGEDPTWQDSDTYMSMNAFGVLGLMLYSYAAQQDSQRKRESKMMVDVPKNVKPQKVSGVSDILDSTRTSMEKGMEMAFGSLPYFIDQSWFVGVSSLAQAITDPKRGGDKFLSTWTGSILAAWWGFSSHAQQLSDMYRETTGKPVSDIRLTAQLKNVEREGYPTIYNDFMNTRFWNTVWGKNELIHKYMVDSQVDTEYISYGVYGEEITPVLGKKVPGLNIAMSVVLPTRAVMSTATPELRFYMAVYRNQGSMKVPGYTMSLAEPGLDKTATISIPGKDKDVLGKANDIPIIIPPKDYNTLVPMAGKITEKLHAKLLEPYMNMEVRGKKITPEMIMDPQFDNVKEIVEIRRGMGVAISEANRIVSSFLKPWELLQKDEIVGMLDMDTAAMIAKAVKDVESRVNIYKSYDVAAGRMDDFYVGVMIDETIAKDLSDLATASIDMYVREAKKSIALEGEWDEYTKIETMTPEQERKMKEGYRRK